MTRKCSVPFILVFFSHLTSGWASVSKFFRDIGEFLPSPFHCPVQEASLPLYANCILSACYYMWISFSLSTWSRFPPSPAPALPGCVWLSLVSTPTPPNTLSHSPVSNKCSPARLQWGPRSVCPDPAGQDVFFIIFACLAALSHLMANWKEQPDLPCL